MKQCDREDLEGTTVGIVFVVKDSRIVHASGPLRDVLGTTREACIGSDLGELLASCDSTVEATLVDTHSYSLRVRDRELEMLLLRFLTTD